MADAGSHNFRQNSSSLELIHWPDAATAIGNGYAAWQEFSCDEGRLGTPLREISTLLQVCAPSDNLMHAQLIAGDITMKFLNSTRSKVFAAVAAVMTLSASAAYAFDCLGYCNTQAKNSGEMARLSYLNGMSATCNTAMNRQSCMDALYASSESIYGAAYSQTMNSCMGQCQP